MVNNVAVDLGYAYVQAKARDILVKFDAYIKQIPESEIDEIRNNIDTLDEKHLLVKYNKKYYVLGQLAITNYPSLTKRLIMDRYDEISIIQYLSAISLLSEDNEILCNLAIGYPNRSRNEKEKAEKMFNGMYQIEFLTRNDIVTKIVRFESIKAIPQPVSVAFSIAEENRENKILVVDIGYGTSDVALLDKMSVSKEVGARYFNRGTELIYKLLEEKIYSSPIVQRHKIPKISEKTLQGIIETGKWKINGVDQPEIKNILIESLREYADELYNNIVANIVNLDECDIMLGSGAIFKNKEFTQYLADKFKEYGFIFATSPQPEWSVVNGLYEFSNLYFEVEEEAEETAIDEEK